MIGATRLSMQKPRRSARAAAAAVLVAVLPALAAPAQTDGAARERGVGPMTLKSRQGPFVVRLLRRDGNTVWLLQQTRGGDFVEAGVPVSQILGLAMPRPRAFDFAEQAATWDQMAQARQALRRVSDALGPFRDLPGAVADEALVLQGRLLDKQENWGGALALYEDVLAQTYPSPVRNEALIRAGLCLARLGRNEEALQRLEQAPAGEDDPDLLSDVCFARGQILHALGRDRDAIMSYLYLVVFHPFVHDNEARCLEAVLPCYIALKDWDAAFKTRAVLHRQYPDSAAAARADELLEPFENEMQLEELYKDSGKTIETEEGEDT